MWGRRVRLAPTSEVDVQVALLKRPALDGHALAPDAGPGVGLDHAAAGHLQHALVEVSQVEVGACAVGRAPGPGAVS